MKEIHDRFEGRGPRPRSIDALTLLELLRRLCLLASPGSIGDNPDDRAKIFKTSVRETTPTSLPLTWLSGEELTPKFAAVLKGDIAGTLP